MEQCNVSPRFVLAGEAAFTLSNGRGDHRTFKVYRSVPTRQFPIPAYFCSVMVGPDNTTDFTYLGKVVVPISPNADPALKLTGRSPRPFGDHAVTIKAARFALRAIWQIDRGTYHLPAGYTIHHEGRCGRCGAKLTNPASLDTGLGPECAEMAGVEWKERSVAGATLFDSPTPNPVHKRKCEKCGNPIPHDHPIEVCAQCAKYDMDYSGDAYLATDMSHPGHPSNYGSR